jgi:hypothetical protein
MALGVLQRRGPVIDPTARVRIGAMRQQHADRVEIVACDRVVQRRPVVDPALLDIGAERQQHLQHFAAVGLSAFKGRDQRRKSRVVRIVGICACFEQSPDEFKRAVIDRVFERDRADPVGPARIGKIRWIAERALECRKIASDIGVVDRDCVVRHAH